MGNIFRKEVFIKDSFIKDKRGVAAVEMAIILPVLILIIVGVLVYGLYFIKYGIVSRTVTTAATSIQINPADTSLQDLAKSSGASLVSYNDPNYICAMSYPTQAAATTGRCSARQWQTTAPSGVAMGIPYYVAVSAFVHKSPLVPLLTDFIPDIKSSVIVQVKQASLPVCNGENQYLQSDGNAYICKTSSNVPVGTVAGRCSVLSGNERPDGSAIISPAILGADPNGQFGSVCSCSAGWEPMHIDDGLSHAVSNGAQTHSIIYTCIKVSGS